MTTKTAAILFLLLPTTLFAAERNSRPENHPAATAARAIGADTVIIGDSYAAGTVGAYLEKKLPQGSKGARYAISSSFVRHWVEKSPSDTQMGPGVGVDWVSPGRSGAGPAPANFPKMRSILKGEAPTARRLIIILGTNGICENATIQDAGKLAVQAKEAVPGIKCYWVGPKLYLSECGRSLDKQKQFSMELGRAVSGSCTFIDSTKLRINPAQGVHKGDEPQQWAEAVNNEIR